MVKPMKPRSFLTATSLLSTGLTVSTLLGIATPSLGQSIRDNRVLLANGRAEDTCIDAVEGQGLRVLDVIDRNEYEGGAEVVLQVRERRQSFTVGCDYADNTRRVQLYRLEGYDYEDDWEQDDEFYGRDGRQQGDEFYGRGSYNGRVNDGWQAEEIARRAVEDQLGVDANSDVIEIENAREGDRRWRVDGRVNGAPFEVWIRSGDGSVEDFRLR